jgi:hypothetical protein
MTDRSVFFCILSILDQLGGISIEQNTLFNEVNLKAPFAVTSEMLREHIAEGLHKGWLSELRGKMGEIRYARTTLGSATLRELGEH